MTVSFVTSNSGCAVVLTNSDDVIIVVPFTGESVTLPVSTKAVTFSESADTVANIAVEGQ